MSRPPNRPSLLEDLLLLPEAEQLRVLSSAGPIERTVLAVVEEAGVFNPGGVRFALAARRFIPGNKHLNFILTIMLTGQILHKQFIAGPVARR